MPETPAPLSKSALVLIDCQNTYREGVMQLEGVEPALAECAKLLDRAVDGVVDGLPAGEAGEEAGGSGDVIGPASSPSRGGPSAASVNTARAFQKKATLVTGAEIMVPGFIKQGDRVKIDTTTGKYVERV